MSSEKHIELKTPHKTASLFSDLGITKLLEFMAGKGMGVGGQILSTFQCILTKAKEKKTLSLESPT